MNFLWWSRLWVLVRLCFWFLSKSNWYVYFCIESAKITRKQNTYQSKWKYLFYMTPTKLLFIHLLHTVANNSSRQYFALARGVAARGGVTSFNRSNRSKEARSGHPPLSSLLLHLPGRGGGSRQELLHKPRAHEKWQECPLPSLIPTESWNQFCPG